MTETCPVQPGAIIWRGLRNGGFGAVEAVGTGKVFDGAWLVPVRFRNQTYGIARALPRMRWNGHETYVLESVRPDNGECARMLRATCAMPEILSYEECDCRIAINEGGVDFVVDVAFAPSGIRFGNPEFLPT